MVITGANGMCDVTSHSLYGSDGAQHPRVALILGNVDRRVSISRKRIGSERRGIHNLGIDGLNGKKRFTVLIRFPAEARGNQVHNFNRGRLPTDENESGDRNERRKGLTAYP